MKRATAIGFAKALAAAGTAEEVDAVIRTRLAPIVDASGAILGIVDRDAGVLRLNLTELVDREIARRYERIRLDDAGPLTHVVRTREPLLVRGRDGWLAHVGPEVADDAMAMGLITLLCLPLIDAGGDVVATLAVAWNEEADVDDAIRATMQTAVELCTDTLGRARATDRAADQATQLARLAELLADALTVEDVLSIVSEHGQAPVGASATSVGLVDRLAGVLRTRHGEAVASNVRRTYADPPLDAPIAFVEAARTGEAVYISDHDAYQARYPESSEVVASLGAGARAAIPLRTAAGDVIGSVVHAWPGPRTFDTALVSTLATIADMTGQAIERAWLLQRIQRDAARSEALASMAERLATAHTSDEVAGVCAAGAAPVVGADSANVALLDRRAGVLQIHHNASLDPGVQARYHAVPLDLSVPHVDVVEDGELRGFDDLDSFGRHYPHLVDELKTAGRQACAVAPLTDSHGRALGAIGFAWSDPTELDGTVRAAMHEVASLCSQALERTQQSDAEHRLVAALQDSVVTDMPRCEGLDCAARHLPAARHIGMGGDWYQGIVLDDHRYAVVVGDVAGHGITAVGYMAQLRATLAALVTLEIPLTDIFGQVTELLRSGDGTVTATAVVAVIDTRADTLTFAAAGHPPPLLRRPDGEARVLGEGRQPLLGVNVAGANQVATCSFEPGSALVLYTDGLVERRREPMDRSIERLARHLGDSRAPDAAAIADELVASTMVAEEPDDDTAIVVVRHLGQ